MTEIIELTILIAEDDDGHAELIQEGLRHSGVHNPIIRFSDGEEVSNFFSGKGEFSPEDNVDAYQPSKAYLLLLDIKMPRMDGVEVLRIMKSDPKLKEIPVIMLTTTDDPREIKHCYALGCNLYITKPVEFQKFSNILKRLGLFIQIVKVC
ncbi:MAG: response regulator [Anaerolineaceae bacterium]|nr:response regulator [Anaerolineaceae bacterium]